MGLVTDRFRPGYTGYTVVFDPVTFGTMAMTAIGSGMTAAGTIASGNAQKAAGMMKQASANYSADQLTENAAGEVGAAQRKMIDTQERTRLATSTLQARAAGGGIDAGRGSPVSDAKEIASKGTYHSLLDLWNGENRSTGMQNQAAGERYTGEAEAIGGKEAYDASLWSAGGTIASGMGTMSTEYGRYRYPNIYNRNA